MKPESSPVIPHAPQDSRPGRAAPAAILFAALAYAPAGAAAPQLDDLPQFDDRTSTFEVIVPVNVVARGGEAVRGLDPEDFQLLDEGRPQQIASFQIIDLDLLAPDDRRVIETDYDVPPAARRHFLFLFDLSYSAPTSIARARAAAQDFVLNEMHPTDLAAVGVHSVESGPQLLVTFTPDRAQLARAITTLGNPRLLRLKSEDPLGFLIDAPDRDFTSSLDVGGVNEGILAMTEQSTNSYLKVIGNQMAKYEKSYARGLISSWIGSLRDMARILGSVDGRKHVVLFSEGFDGRLLFGRQPDFTDPEMHREIDAVEQGQYAQVDFDDRFGNTQLQGQVDLMLNEFNTANTVVHTVDISGLRADLPAENRMRTVGRDALFYIANETGGRLHEDANDFGAELGEVLESSTVTYLLSFRPSDPGKPGDHHRLRVRTRAPKGSSVSHRMGYRTPRPFGDLHPMEKRLLASDLIASAAETDGLKLDVLAAPFRAGDGSAYIPVIVEIDGTSLLAEHEATRLPVEIYGYVTDEQSQMRDFFSQIVTLELTGREDAFASTGLKYYGHLGLGPGRYLLRVLARNRITGRTGVETTELVVPAFGSGDPVLLPPFFHEELGRWFLVRERPANEYASTTVYPFTVNGEPYVPAAAPLVRTSEADDQTLVYLIGYNFSPGALALETEVTNDAGEVVSGGVLTLRERTVTGIRGLDKLVASFDPADLPAGDYTLRVAVVDPATQERFVNSTSLKLLN